MDADNQPLAIFPPKSIFRKYMETTLLFLMTLALFVGKLI